jgi:cytochrome c peroxidase
MNTPTVFNAGFNQYQMWSGRVALLEQQIDDVINNDKHMNSSWPAILQRLRRHDVYPALFADIYADGISVPAIQDALATFERSLITPDSAFDRYLRGDKQAISSEQKEGFRLFKDYGCISCHQGINLGGNVRALLGVFIERTKPGSDARGGSAEVELPQSEVNIYRAPPLRNVARTAPYFHNGSIANLHEAVIVMARSQLGRDMPAEHADKIVAFLDSLTGEYRGKPL